MEKNEEKIKVPIDEDSSLSINESCVRSDIANLISKIYTPRAIPLNYSADDSTMWKDFHGDGSWRENEGKKFGFYFSPVTRRVVKAKPILDSSTTSGSVSLPVLTCKPRRVRHVCECCKRKPSKSVVYMTRKKRTDCKICRRNNCIDAEASSTTSMRRVEPPVHIRKTLMSNEEIIQIHPIHSLKTNNSKETMKLDQTQSVKVDKLQSSNTFQFINQSENSQLNPPCNVYHIEEAASENKPLLTRIFSLMFGRTRRRDMKTHKSAPIFTGKPIETEYTKRVLILGQEVNHNELNFAPAQNTIKNVFIDNRENKNDLESRDVLKSTVIQVDRSQTVGQRQVPTTDQGASKEVYPGANGLNNKMKHHSIECERENNKCYIKPSESYSKKSLNITGAQLRADPPSDLENPRNQSTNVGCDDSNFTQYLKEERNKDWPYVFWSRVFAACDYFISFFTAFLLNLLRFLMQSIIHPLVCGTIRVVSENFLKPCLLTLFDSLLQPLLNLLLRIALSLRDLCFPIAQCCGFFCKETSHICRACRVVEVHKHYHRNEESKGT